MLPDVADSDTAQLLYTSGTTSKPKGAIMSHRALVHEYMSSVLALGCTENDTPLHPMPLYHSAGMHVFLMPYLAVGATNHILATPDIPDVLRHIELHRLSAVFLAPTVWVPLVNHPNFLQTDLSTLTKAFYGASIMPAVTLERLQERCPDAGLYNCFGQSEIGPLATVLGPDEHAERPLSCGRSVMFVEMRVVNPTSRTSNRTRWARSSIDHPNSATDTGTSPRRQQMRSARDGSGPATSRDATRPATSRSSIGSRT